MASVLPETGIDEGTGLSVLPIGNVPKRSFGKSSVGPGAPRRAPASGTSKPPRVWDEVPEGEVIQVKGKRSATTVGPVPTKTSVLEGVKAKLKALPSKSTPDQPIRVTGSEQAWDKILGPEVPKEDRAEAIDVLKKLAFLDSIHDFWPERGASKKKKEVTDANEEAPLDEPPGLTPEQRKERIEAVRKNLVDSIRKYLGKDSTKPIEDILRETTGGDIASTSTIENKVLAYFKKKYKPFNEPERTIKVSDVLQSWKFSDYGSDWTKYQAAIRALPTLVDIPIDGTFIKSLDQEQLGHLGFFILACLDPDTQPGQGSKDVYFTFDMNAGDIGKIFTRFKQVKNAIYPQNIADSAKTSFSALNGRSVFFRPDYAKAVPGAKAKPHEARANAFTQGKYTIEFVDKGFSSKNRFGFSVLVKEDGVKIGEIEFGKGVEQGPSVNYLMDLVIAENDAKRKEIRPKSEEIALLNKFEKFDRNLLFDIKRLGDQEQMLAETAYGITGDRFAGAFRRLLRKPGIFQSSSGFRVWRGRSEIPSDELEKQAREFRKMQVIEKLRIVAGSSREGEVLNSLKKMRNEAIKGAAYGKVFLEPEDIAPLTKERIAAKYTEIASTFATYLLRRRMRDMASQIDALITKASEIMARVADKKIDINDAACLIGQPKPIKTEEETACADPTTAPGITDEALDNALDTLEKFIESVNELESLKIGFTKWDNGGEQREIADTYTKLFSRPSYRLMKGSSSTLFNFSAGPFLHPETGISTVVARLLALSTRDEAESFETSINKLLVMYLSARDEIKEAFVNKDEKNKVEEETDITSGISPVRVLYPPEFNVPVPGAAAAAASGAPPSDGSATYPASDGNQGILEVLLRMEQVEKLDNQKWKALADAIPPEPAEVGDGDGAAAPLVAADEGMAAAVAEEDEVLGVGEDQVGAPAAAASAAPPRKEPTGREVKSHILQYRDLHDLFVSICIDANVALEAARNSEENSAKIIASALNEIDMKWFLEVDQLRKHARDDYGAMFEETATTDLISFLLSFRSDKNPSFAIAEKYNDTRDRIYFTFFAVKITGAEIQNFVENSVLVVLAGIGTDVLKIYNENPEYVYSAPAQWKNKLPADIQVFVTSLITSLASGSNAGLPTNIIGGGLDATHVSTSNDGGSSSIAPRRRLYEGLRKRGGSGSAPGV